MVVSVPEEFNYDPVSKTYGEPQRRPEIRSATIEFIAPSEYMVCTVPVVPQHILIQNVKIKLELHMHICQF